MRVLNFYEFCELPDGAVFSYWEPCIVSGLYRRGNVISDNGRPIDFFEASLVAASWDGEPPVCDLIESRWGIFDYEQLFLVYEQRDVATIAKGLGVVPKEQR